MERSGYEDFEAGVVRENRGLRMMSFTRRRGRWGRGGGGGGSKQVFRVKRLLRMSFFLIANACKLHL